MKTPVAVFLFALFPACALQAGAQSLETIFDKVHTSVAEIPDLLTYPPAEMSGR